MITRKDLMGFNLEEKIGQVMEKQHVEMTGPIETMDLDKEFQVIGLKQQQHIK